MKKIDEEYFKKSIAKKVKEIRKDSQEVLAENANISIDTVSKIEREISVINSLTLVKICNALNVTPNDILEEFIDIKPNINELNKRIITLSDEERDYLLSFFNLMDSIKKNKK